MKNIWDYSQAVTGLSLATFVVFMIILLWWIPYSQSAALVEDSSLDIAYSAYSPYTGSTVVKMQDGITKPLDTDAVYINDCRTNGVDGYARGVNMHYNSVIDINGNFKNNAHNLSDITLMCNNEFVPQTVAEGTVGLNYPMVLDPIDTMYYMNSVDDQSTSITVTSTPNPTTTLDINTSNYPDPFAESYNAFNHFAVLADSNSGLINDVRSNLTDLQGHSVISGQQFYNWNNMSIDFPNGSGNATRGDMKCPPGTRITGLRTHVRDLEGNVLQQLQNRAVTDIELICSPF